MWRHHGHNNVFPAFHTRTNMSDEEQRNNQRYIVLTYCIFVFISALIGDVIILLATTRYRAIKLHPLIITQIQHIAVCDLTLSFVEVLPRIVHVIARRVFIGGSDLNNWRVYVQMYLYSVALYQMCALTTSKLVIVRNPTRAKHWKQRQGNIVCAIVWVGCLVIPLLMVLVDMNIIKINQTVHETKIANNIKFPVHSFFLPAIVGVFIPCVVLIISTILILVVLVRGRDSARKSGGKVRWQGIVTVLTAAIVFCVSNLPYVIWIGIIYLPQFKGQIPTRFTKIALALPLLNVMANFYIYCLTVPSFRRFLVSKIRSSVGWCCPYRLLDRFDKHGSVESLERRGTETIRLSSI